MSWTLGAKGGSREARWEGVAAVQVGGGPGFEQGPGDRAV